MIRTTLTIALMSAAMAQAQTASISGLVSDRDTDAILNCQIVLSTSSGEWVGSATCDGNGRYEFTELEADSYRLTATSDPDYVEIFWPSTVFWDERGTVDLADGELRDDIDFELFLGARLAGSVVEAETALALEGALVRLVRPDWRWAAPVAQADANGDWQFFGVPPDDYVLYAWEAGDDASHVIQYWPGTAASNQTTLITTIAQEHLSDFDFALPIEAAISGRIIDIDTGLAIEGSGVTLSERDYRWARGANAVADGSFRVGLIPAGDYRVYADAADYERQYLVDTEGELIFISLSPGDEIPGLLFELQQGGAIEGRVLRRDGSPVSSGWASAFRPEDYVFEGARTDDDGRFRIGGLPAGDYQISAQGNDGDNLIPATLVDVEGEPVLIPVVVGETAAGYVITLDPGAIISGTVSSEEGDALEGLRVFADEVDGYGWRQDFSDENGEYRIVGLSDSPQVVAAGGQGYIQQFYEGAAVVEEATPLLPQIDDELSGIDFALSSGGAVSGTVIDLNTGGPIERIFVGLYSSQFSPVPGAWDVSDENGQYLIEGAPEYEAFFVRAYDWDDRYAWQWYQGAQLFAGADTISVALGEVTSGINFALFQPGTLAVSPQSLAFSGLSSDDEITGPDLVVTNQGPGPASISVWSEADWLSVAFDAGDGLFQVGESRVIRVKALPWGFAPGDYSSQVVIYDNLRGRPGSVAVSLSLEPGDPTLSSEPSQLYFEAFEGQSEIEAESLWIANVGGGEISVSASVDVSWLELSRSEWTLGHGGNATHIGVTATAADLAPGTYDAVISLTSSGGDQAISVTLGVDADEEGEGDLAVPKSVILLVEPGARGETVSKNFEISNDGNASIRFNVGQEVPWISVEPTWSLIAPGASATLTMTVDTAALELGMNSTFLEISSADDSETVEIGVQLGVEVQAAASVEASTSGQLVIPVVVHASGVQGVEFVSDLWIAHRPGADTINATLIFIPEGGRAGALTTEISFEPGKTISMLDVLETWLDGAISKGSLVIQADCIEDVEAVSRTFAKSTEGTFGQEIPAVSSRQGVGQLGGRLYIPGLERSTDFRSNLLLTEVSGNDIQAKVSLVAADGSVLGTEEFQVSAFSTNQLNNVFASVGVGAGAHSAVRAEISVSSGLGSVVAIGSKVDNATNDPTTLFGVPKGVDISTAVIPVVANANGLAGTKWRSDVTISNVDGTDRTVTLRYYRSGGALGGQSEHLIAAGQTLEIEDVVGQFSAAGSQGSLQIDISPPGGLAMTSRTFNQGPDGTLGQGIQALSHSDAVKAGSGVVRLIALTNNPRLRTNIGITEMLGASVRVGVTIRSQTGKQLGYKELTVPAFGQFQANLFNAMGLAGESIHAATAIIQVIGGAGGITAYGSTIDNATGDATTLPPPQRIRAEQDDPEGNPAEEGGGAQ